MQSTNYSQPIYWTVQYISGLGLRYPAGGPMTPLRIPNNLEPTAGKELH